MNKPVPLPWISIADRLPDPTDYLVLASDGHGAFLANYIDDEVGWLIVFGPVSASGVLITHWLPLTVPEIASLAAH